MNIGIGGVKMSETNIFCKIDWGGGGGGEGTSVTVWMKILENRIHFFGLKANFSC